MITCTKKECKTRTRSKGLAEFGWLISEGIVESVRIRKTGTRRVLLDQLPKNVKVPKFFSPTDINNLLQMRKIDPHVSWEESINQVVFQSVPDLVSVLSK